MKKIPIWKRKIMEIQAKRIMNKIYKDNEIDLRNIKDTIADEIENKTTKEQTNYIIILCSEIISGFEEKETRQFCIDMIKTVVENIP